MELSELKKHLPEKLDGEQKMAVDNIIYCAKVGSHMYGTATKESDTDIVGIFIPDMDYVIGMKKCEQVDFRTNPSGSGKRNSKKDVDITLYSLPKFIHLASGCNPNIIEVLFAQNPYMDQKYGKILWASADAFISQKIRDTFGGYAHSQMKKLTVKKDRLSAIKKATEEVNKLVIDTDDVHIFYDGLPHDIQVKGHSTVYKTYAKGSNISDVRKDLDILANEYGLRTKSVEMHGYDTKFAMHLIRLLKEGLTLLATGQLDFPLPYAAKLIAIKRGEMDQDKLLTYAAAMMEEIDHIDSDLPKHANMSILNHLQVVLIKGYWEEKYDQHR